LGGDGGFGGGFGGDGGFGAGFGGDGGLGTDGLCAGIGDRASCGAAGSFPCDRLRA
jgi:hypothetical protein